MKESKTFVEEKLVSYANELQCPNVLREAMAYSLEAGGKRLRPLLLFATLQAFGKERNLGVGATCALEIIHTYSLVHDDLPCMDDDDLRRGKPTNHKVFGEAMAVLAGDGLLTYAFQVIMAYEQKKFLPKKVRLVLELAKAAGPEGMVGGQVADMEAEGNALRLMNWSTSINIRPENCLNLLYLRVRYFLMRQKSKKKSCLRLPNISV